MISNIPDKLYKLLVLLGIFLIGFGYIKSNESYEQLQVLAQNKIDLKDSLMLHDKNFRLGVSVFLDNFEKGAQDYATAHYFKNGRSRPLKDVPVELSEVEEDSLFQIRSKLSAQLFSGFDTDRDGLRQYELKLRQFENEESQLNLRENFVKRKIDDYNSAIVLGCFLFALGVFMWGLDTIRKPIVKQDEKVYSSCQSCGFEFSPMVQYGSRVDGSAHYAFCLDCFKDGAFSEPKITFNRVLLRYLNRHGIKRNSFSVFRWRRYIRRLGRWKFN